MRSNKTWLLGFITAVAAAGWVARGDAPAAGPTPVDSAESPVREGPAPLDPRAQGVGRLVADVELKDLDGKPLRLASFRGRPLVVFMTSPDCPVARKYLPVLAAIEKEFAERGVAFVAVNAKGADSAPAMREALAAAGFGGPCAVDPTGALAAALGAVSSTDAFVLDAARTLAYRGAVDDQFGLGYALPKPRRQFLRDALAAVLSGNRPAVEATSAPGCVLEAPKPAAAAAGAAVTYHSRVSRIVQRNCADCHRAGENGPFTLTSYQDVKENLATIRRVVRRGVMPPWFADAKVGHWANDRSLSPADRDDLLAWIDAGAPEGDAADAPVEPKFAAGWKIGQPDAVFETPYPFKVAATGAMEYQRVLVQTHLPEDRWVTAVEIRPSSPAVVHHVLVFVSYPPDHPRLGEQPRYKDGLDGYFAGLVPGQGHVVYPPGVAKFIPRDALLTFQIHYTPNGTPTEDRPRIGMVFSKGPPEHELSTRGAFNTKFKIPPGDGNFEVTASHLFQFPVRLLSFNPHSHVRGKAYRYEAVYPDGRTETVLEIPRYDFNWQLEYFLREPLDLPAGTRLKVTAWYDNSEKNPANPDPKATVHFGDQTWDEMMIGYFSGYRLR
jgi:thiol-disulfide isomerase/thioredoxin/mono/diheme cytochrome c family protein